MLTEFTNTNSLIHKLNPNIKVIIFGILIVIAFLPFGLTWQLLTLFIIHLFWLSSKLKWKSYKKTLITFIVMFIFLLLINWFSYKDPGVSFVFDYKNKLVGPNWWWQNSSVGTYLNHEENLFLAGNVFGGEEIDYDLLSENINIGIKDDITHIGKGFFKIFSDSETLQQITNYISDKGYTLIQAPSSFGGETYFYVYNAEFYSLSSNAIMLALSNSIKIFSTILIVNIFVSTTSAVQLTYSFSEILHPLNFLKIPVNELAMMISITIRHIPSLLEEAYRVLKAQASRGIDIKKGKFLDKSKALISLLIPMFAIAFRKSEELSNAMEARGYNPRVSRSRYRNFDLKFIDWLFLAFIGIFFGITLFFSLINSFGNITFLFAPLGIYDAINLIG